MISSDSVPILAPTHTKKAIITLCLFLSACGSGHNRSSITDGAHAPSNMTIIYGDAVTTKRPPPILSAEAADGLPLSLDVAVQHQHTTKAVGMAPTLPAAGSVSFLPPLTSRIE